MKAPVSRRASAEELTSLIVRASWLGARPAPTAFKEAVDGPVVLHEPTERPVCYSGPLSATLA